MLQFDFLSIYSQGTLWSSVMVTRRPSSTCINEVQPYGEDVTIVKHECVGHVQKQLGKHLRDVKKVSNLFWEIMSCLTLAKHLTSCYISVHCAVITFVLKVIRIEKKAARDKVTKLKERLKEARAEVQCKCRGKSKGKG